MNSIGKLIKAKTISFNEMLIRHYTKLKLDEKEAMILMLLYVQQDEGNSLLVTESLKSKVAMSEDELSSIIVQLVQKGYIELLINNEGKETFNLDKVIDALGEYLADNDEHQEVTDRTLQLQEIVSYAEKCYQKVLTSNDLIIINHWLDLNYRLEDIEQAILDSLKAKKLHLKYADAILVNRKKERTKVTEVDEDIKQMLQSVYVKRN